MILLDGLQTGCDQTIDPEQNKIVLVPTLSNVLIFVYIHKIIIVTYKDSFF